MALYIKEQSIYLKDVKGKKTKKEILMLLL